MDISRSGARLYEECCVRCNVKPNTVVLGQVSRPDLLNLRRIDASQTFLGPNGVHAVLEFVRQNRLIEELVLCKNGVDGKCVERLCGILAEGHPSLRSIDLSDNALSVPVARKLWESARAVPTLTTVRLDGCGVSSEWEDRVQRLVKSNEELQTMGFFPYGPERPVASWHTAFVLLVGNESRLNSFCRDVLPLLGCYVAQMRVRVAPIVVDASDNVEQVHGKVRRCREALNHNRPWCVILSDATPFTAESQLAAIEEVVKEPPPVVEPLKSKMGVMRAAVHRPVENCFVYYCSPEDVNEDVHSLTAASWLPLAGFKDGALSCGSQTHYKASVLLEEAYVVRCCSDLLLSLNGLFKEPPHTEMSAQQQQQSVVPSLSEAVNRSDLSEEAITIGALHNIKTNYVLEHIRSPPCEKNIPLVMYGAGDHGKSGLLAHVASIMRKDTDQAWRTALVAVDLNDASVIVFLYRVLLLLNPSAALHYSSIRELSRTVHNTIVGYTGSPLVLLASCVDALDLCGADASMGIDWLPSVLPPSMKIVLSLNTESPILPLLRQRCPQPYECLVPPVIELNRIELLRVALQERGVVMPGLKGYSESTRKIRTLTMTETAFIKKGCSSILYIHLAAAYIQLTLGDRAVTMSEYDISVFLDRELPNTPEDLIEGILVATTSMSDASTIKHILLCLAIAPLPVTELQVICEDLSHCTPHSTVPNLLLLLDNGLIEWNADSKALISKRCVRSKIMHMYAEDLDRMSVVVETHLYRLVVTCSPEAPSSFQYLVPLMLTNGNFNEAAQLLQNTGVMDNLLTERPESRMYIIDGLFRLLLSWDLLAEMALAGNPMNVELDVKALGWALKDAQRYGSSLFQCALLQSSHSPYAMAASKQLGDTPYPVLLPTNCGSEESERGSYSCDEQCVSIRSRDGILVVTTTTSVRIINTKSGGIVAKIISPFSSRQPLKGALLAVGTRVAILASKQVVVWDYAANTFNTFENVAVEAEPASLNTFGTDLIGITCSTGDVCVLDLPKKTCTKLASKMTSVRRVRYCGHLPLMVGTDDICLVGEHSASPSILHHDGLIGEVDCSADGRLIASSVGSTLWVWMATTGELLHRLETGYSLVTALLFNHCGSHLIVRRAQSIQLWRTAQGSCLGNLQNPFEDESSEVDEVHFTLDDAAIFGVVGRRIVFWDGKTDKIRGARTAHTGLFTAVSVEEEGTLYAATTAAEISVFGADDPIPTILDARAGTLTTNWTRNSRVSTSPIRTVSTSSNGTFMMCLSADGLLQVYATSSGSRLYEVCNVRTAIMAGVDRLAYMEHGQSHISFLNVKMGGDAVICPLPREVIIVDEGSSSSSPTLYSSEDGGYVGLACAYGGHSRLVVFDPKTPALHCQCVGHAGDLLAAHFFGCFAYTVGQDDGYLRLWNLQRCVERTAVQHAHKIEATTCDGSGLLMCVDATKSVFQVHVGNIASATRSSFVFTKVDLPTLSRHVAAWGTAVRRLLVVDQHLVVIPDGAHYMVAARVDKDGPVHEIRISDCTSVCTATKDRGQHVLIGNSMGHVASMRVITPRNVVAHKE